jgi:hypothetical protein
MLHNVVLAAAPTLVFVVLVTAMNGARKGRTKGKPAWQFRRVELQ